MDVGEGVDMGMDVGEVVKGGAEEMVGETGGGDVVVQFYNAYQ